ncbi:MAG: TIGR04222 domain-containing membrane protein [Cyanobacteriota bacterium]|jgi:uncharacterized protein (TIGR04222 family)
MKEDSRQLYQRLLDYPLNDPSHAIGFLEHLKRNNGWSQHFSLRAIEEYRKFVFLAMVADHQVTPSDQVDQVWHQHLLFSDAYWNDFCPRVLGRPLHHEPTRGGAEERQRFEHLYLATLASYREHFGEPPIDLWPPLNVRFSRDQQMQRRRIKPLLGQIGRHKQGFILFLLLMIASAVTGCQMASTVPNPLDFKGTDFLSFYFLLSSIAVLLALLLRAKLRIPSSHRQNHPVSVDVYETAYLAGGKNRAVDTAIATLVQNKSVTVEPVQKTLKLQEPRKEFSSPIERAVANAIASSGQIDDVRSATTRQTGAIRDRLRQLGLLVMPNQSIKAQIYPAVILVGLLALGIAKIGVGISRGRPVGFLVMMCLVLSVAGLCFLFVPVHRSRYGDQVLQEIRSRIPSAPVRHADPQLPLAFALLGAAILPTDTFADLKQMFTPVSSGGDGGGGCGGGGCGGGCGGCGG